MLEGESEEGGDGHAEQKGDGAVEDAANLRPG